MPHFSQRFRFDLANALPRDLKLPAYFLEGSAVSIDQPKPLLEHLPLAFSQSLENILDLLLQQNNSSHIARVFVALILDKVAKIGFLALPHGFLQRDRLLSPLQDRANAIYLQ